ncbi:MAG: Gfo/Idh/MocA family oxidoreductase [Hydrococcus sp. C42_A2020_068]|nr:Gfo/Idh/MocA family oxidoreductase [Hydrococcus sp. C42_A2020_068]
MKNSAAFTMSHPIKVGIVGTGYAASKRAEAFQADDRAQVIVVAGNTPEKTEAFCQAYSVAPLDSWQQLVSHPDVDVVVISNINRDRASIARAALLAGKHVVTEYPLALSYREAEEILALSQQQNKLLHVEHIELLGGLHQAIRQSLPEIGDVFYARYVTITPQRPVPRRWTFHYQMFGFPLTAALSRIHRLTDLFGTVASVTCQSRFWDAPESGYYTACLCDAQLRFTNGLIADVIYGKGEVFWDSDRTFELRGDRGTLIFEGETGNLIRGEEKTAIEVVSRKGLFVKDTQMVLNCLTRGTPLYINPEASLYALKVAEAAERSAITGKTIEFS